MKNTKELADNNDDLKPPGKISQVYPISVRHGVHLTNKELKCIVSTPEGKIIKTEAVASGGEMYLNVRETVHIIVEIN